MKTPTARRHRPPVTDPDHNTHRSTDRTRSRVRPAVLWWLRQCSTALALSGTLLGSSSALAQYKWIDQEGVVHYSDLPPPAGLRSVNRAEPFRSLPRAESSPRSAMEPESTAGSRLPPSLAVLARRAPVVLYAIAGCVPCDEGRSLLRQRGVPYAERRIETAQDLKALGTLDLPSTGFPLLSVGRERAIGFEPGQWQRILDHAGYPGESMLPTQWQPEPARPLAAPPAPAASIEAGAGGVGSVGVGSVGVGSVRAGSAESPPPRSADRPTARPGPSLRF